MEQITLVAITTTSGTCSWFNAITCSVAPQWHGPNRDAQNTGIRPVPRYSESDIS